jgi:hypothetical protein
MSDRLSIGATSPNTNARATASISPADEAAAAVKPRVGRERSWLSAADEFSKLLMPFPPASAAGPTNRTRANGQLGDWVSGLRPTQQWSRARSASVCQDRHARSASCLIRRLWRTRTTSFTFADTDATITAKSHMTCDLCVGGRGFEPLTSSVSRNPRAAPVPRRSSNGRRAGDLTCGFASCVKVPRTGDVSQVLARRVGHVTVRDSALGRGR